MTANSWDEYLRIYKSTCGNDMVMLGIAMVKVFGLQYFREPVVADTKKLMTLLEEREWPSMLGSLDCTQSKLKKCPSVK